MASMTLDNREIATLFWLCTLVACLLRGKARSGLKTGLMAVFKASFAPKLIPFWLAATSWVLVSIWALHCVGLWTASALKTTLIWAFGFAFLSIFRLVRVTHLQPFLRNTVLGIISVTAIVEFIAEAYTFSLWLELVLVPIVSLLAMIEASTEGKKPQAPAHRLATRLLTGLGLIYVAYGTYRVLNGWEDFAGVETARQFFTPVFLSLAYLPFLLATCVFMAHERFATASRFGIKPPALARYARWQALLRFRADLEGLRRFQRNAMTSRPQSHADVRALIREVKTLQAREKAPPSVDPIDGWSPYAATHYLADRGLGTKDYHRHYDDIWGANSPYKEIGEQTFLRDNIAYYVEGDEHTARTLKLVLNVNHLEQAAESDAAFLDDCVALLNALGYYVDNAGREALGRVDELDEHIPGIRLQVSKEAFSRPDAGYSRRLIIEWAQPTPSSSST